MADISDHTPEQPFHCASLAGCRLSLSVLVWAPERFNWSSALLTEKCKNVEVMTSFNIEVLT